MKLFGYPVPDESGAVTLTRTEGEFADMLMNITVYRMKAGETRRFHLPEEEMALLLVEGCVDYQWPDGRQTADRKDFFREGAYCLHVCHDVPVTVTAHRESELLVQSTVNSGSFPAVFYTPKTIREETFGQGQFDAKAQRTVRTFFDYASAPYSNMVMGEILQPQGGWSSYPPHQHPQPEVYYYRFDKPQGFGSCFIGDDVFRIQDRSFCAIPGGKTHPQVTAPGYPMYYVWMIRHFDGYPWTERIFDPAHAWLLE